jgi:CTP:molybdopterin cytidylyltransferase MocA
MNNNIGVIILSAGISRRMNSPKSSLKFDDTKTFFEKIVEEYESFGCNEIIVIINEQTQNKYWKAYIKEASNNVIFVINDHLEYERFYSVKIGLKKLGKSDCCFIQNIDNPFVEKDLLMTIYDNRLENGYVSPRFKGQGGHPILLGKKVINNIKDIKENNLNFRDVMANYNCNKVEIDNPNILTNINTIEEYNRYFKPEN